MEKGFSKRKIVKNRMLGTWVFMGGGGIWDIFIIWETVLRIYKISSVSGALKIKHWP